MAIRFNCSCGKALRADESQVGKRSKCPECGTALIIPAEPRPIPAGDVPDFAVREAKPIDGQATHQSRPSQDEKGNGTVAHNTSSLRSGTLPAAMFRPAGNRKNWHGESTTFTIDDLAKPTTAVKCPKCDKQQQILWHQKHTKCNSCNTFIHRSDSRLKYSDIDKRGAELGSPSHLPDILEYLRKAEGTLRADERALELVQSNRR